VSVASLALYSFTPGTENHFDKWAAIHSSSIFFFLSLPSQLKDIKKKLISHVVAGVREKFFPVDNIFRKIHLNMVLFVKP